MPLAKVTIRESPSSYNLRQIQAPNAYDGTHIADRVPNKFLTSLDQHAPNDGRSSKHAPLEQEPPDQDKQQDGANPELWPCR